MTKKEQVLDTERTRQHLLSILQPGQTIYTKINTVTKSGMSRKLSVFVAINNQICDITWSVAQVTNFSCKDNEIRVSGCGFDAGFEVIYQLGHALFPTGFTCIGEGCRSNDHSNGDKNYTPHHHKDGGYIFRHSHL